MTRLRLRACEVLLAGSAAGRIVTLTEPLSFWGGFDPAEGTIIDRAHPQHGRSLKDVIVVMAGSRGSSGTPGVLGEALRLGTGPAALLITKPDINLVAGARVAAALYGATCPIVVITDADVATIADGAHARVDGEAIEISPPAD